MAHPEVPTLFEWLGGMDPLRALTKRFYEKVPTVPLLEPIFAHMGPDHPEHVALFLAEVLGGPKEYSERLGGHPEMVRHHLGKHITDAQRKAWMGLLLETADELGLPGDPEFRSAIVGYLEWGSRLAVVNSKGGEVVVDEKAAMPEWGWGQVGGPYIPPQA